MSVAPPRYYFITKLIGLTAFIALLAIILFKSPLWEDVSKSQLPDLREIQKRIPAPELTLTDSQGRIFELKNLRGKVIYLNFWATWCGPCLEELPFLAQLTNNYFDKDDFISFFVNVDKIQSDELKNILTQLNPNIIFVLDINSKIKNHFSVNKVPTHVLIDKNGKVAFRYPKTLLQQEEPFKDLVLRLLKEDSAD